MADFKMLNLYDIEVKIDSGAYTSSFHCHKIEKVVKNEREVIRCNFLDPGHSQYHEKEFSFKNFKIRNVKSSNGVVEERFAVTTEITIFELSYTIELTLTERQEMKYPVLLGRKFLSKKFIIDTSKKNLSLKGKKLEI